MHFGLNNAGEAMSRDIVIYKGSRQFVVDVIKDLEKRLDALEGDDGEKGKAMSNEREAMARMQAYLAERVPVRGIDQELIHCMNDKELRVSDIAALLAARQPAGGWIRAVDEAMVVTHLGIAETTDDYEVAKKKLVALIQWHVTVALDQATSVDAQALIDQGRQSAGATDQEPVGIIGCDEVNGWHMNALVDWEKIGIGTKLYAAPIGDNGAKSSGSVAFDYGNRLVNAKLDPSYAQPSNEPIPQHLEGQSYDAWDAFQKHPESQMSNSDDFWPIWRDAWDAAREQPAESKRAELTEEQWRSIQAPTGNRLFDAGVHHACVSIRALLSRASDKGE